MADISQINKNGTTYDIKDTVARASGVPSGGTTNQVLTKFPSGYGWSDVSGSGGGGYNFSNITLVAENTYSGAPISTEVENGFIVAMYHNFSDGNNYWYFDVVPKELLNLIPSGKDMYHKFRNDATYGFENVTHSNNTYSFSFRKDADTERMNLYKF